MFIEAKYFGLNADYTRRGRDRKVTEGIAGSELSGSGQRPSQPPGLANTDGSDQALEGNGSTQLR
jgi:hypothetical protein